MTIEDAKKQLEDERAKIREKSTSASPEERYYAKGQESALRLALMVLEQCRTNPSSTRWT